MLESCSRCIREDRETMSKLDDASRPGPCAAVLRVERAVCATGTAWGLLKGQPFWVLILYWAFR